MGTYSNCGPYNGSYTESNPGIANISDTSSLKSPSLLLFPIKVTKIDRTSGFGPSIFEYNVNIGQYTYQVQATADRATTPFYYIGRFNGLDTLPKNIKVTAPLGENGTIESTNPPKPKISRNKIEVISDTITDVYMLDMQAQCEGRPGVEVSVKRTLNTKINGVVMGSPTQNVPNIKKNDIISIISNSDKKINNQHCDGRQCKSCNANQEECVGCDCFINGDNPVLVPIITISGQTTVDYCNIGDMIFTICDKYIYYNEVPISTNTKTCKDIYINPDELKSTRLIQCCPNMVKVLKGRGCTLFDKASYIYDRMSESIGPSLYDFYINLIFYSMVRYILARILYGEFNIKYLLNKYYEKFLIDLGNSRFCGALQFFNDSTQPTYGYNKFFKSGNHK